MKAAIQKLRAAFASSAAEDNSTPEGTTTVEQTNVGKTDAEADLQKPDDVEAALVTESAQHGVQTVQATTLVWTRTALASVFVL